MDLIQNIWNDTATIISTESGYQARHKGHKWMEQQFPDTHLSNIHQQTSQKNDEKTNSEKTSQKSNRVNWMNGLDSLIPLYDAFIIDLWGVIHDGYQLYPGVLECLDTLIKKGKTVIFLSNAPRPNTVMKQKLIEFGLNLQDITFVTSGDIVREQLQSFTDQVFKTLGRRCFHLGAERNQDILADLEIISTNDIEQADFVLLTAYLDEGEDQAQFDDLFQKALCLNLAVICANPDTNVINGDKMRYCAGVFAARYKAMGGTVHYYGKPHALAYQAILENLKNKNIQDRSRILMIGDTVDTDIKGAATVGIHSALVLSGNTGIYLAENQGTAANENTSENQAKEENKDKRQEQILERLFTETSVTPTWIIPGLRL